MTETSRWRTDGVMIMRAGVLNEAMRAPSGAGRATAFNFAGSGRCNTWIGAVTLPPAGRTVPHHHGRHEVAIYVVSGRGRIRWGDRLEFAAEIGPGDFIYFAPYVPHQELNVDSGAPLDFVVVRSDGEAIAIGLDVVPVEQPETVF